MGSTISKDSTLDSHLATLGIPHTKPTSPDFDAQHESFTGSQPLRRPGLIVRPQTPDHVATVVRLCVENRLPLVVRGGGHDMYGRYAAEGAVSIDLRDLNHVTIDPSHATVDKNKQKTTVWIQGGTTMLQALEVLEKNGLTVAVGTCGTVGFVGWSLIAGLGPYMHSYGIGADQIVGARVVNAKGKLVDANKEMLKGLRGGGGNMGVVTELQVKAHPFQQIHAGEIMYDSTDIRRTSKTFLSNFAALLAHDVPRQFSLQPQFWLVPGVGLSLVCNLIWNGPADDTYKEWLQKVGELAPLMQGSKSMEETVTQMSPRAFSRIITDHLPNKVLGGSHSATAARLSDDFIDEMVECIHDLPRDGAGGLSLHIMRDSCPSLSSSQSIPESVCPFRNPGVHVEILGVADDEERAEKAMAWARRTRDRLMALPGASKVAYFPLTAPELYDAKEMYGEEKLRELRRLKGKFDPEGVFRYAIPSV